jgi:hypothetical protein
MLRQSTQMHPQQRALPSGAHHCIVLQQAINVLTLQEHASYSTVHTPCTLMKHAEMPIHFEHFVSPIEHPVKGQTISSNKKGMNNPTTAEVWQGAFGQDFGRMAQVDNKPGQKGTNVIFMMTHNEIAHALTGKRFSLMETLLSITDRRRSFHIATDDCWG